MCSKNVKMTAEWKRDNSFKYPNTKYPIDSSATINVNFPSNYSIDSKTTF